MTRIREEEDCTSTRLVSGQCALPGLHKTAEPVWSTRWQTFLIHGSAQLPPFVMVTGNDGFRTCCPSFCMCMASLIHLVKCWHGVFPSCQEPEEVSTSFL